MSFYNWDHHLKRKFQKGLRCQPKTSLYLSSALRDVGLGIINVFIPIYLFQVYENISLVFVFMILYHLTIVITAFSIARLIKKIGLDLTGLLAGWLRIVFFWLMILGKTRQEWLWLAAVVWGITISFTWLTHHYYLTVIDEDSKFGKEVAGLMLIDRWLFNIMPLIGGMILKVGSYQLMFIIAMIFVGISGVPLFWDRFNKKRMRVNWQKTIDSGWFKRHKRISVAFLAAGAKSEVVTVVWPIYLFLVVNDYLKVGIIQAASLLLASILLIWLGKQVDRDNKKMIRPALWLNSANLAVRGMVGSGLGLFLLQSAYQLTACFVWVPFDAQIYEIALKEKEMEFFVRREWLLHIGGLISAMLLAGAFWAGLSWRVVFIFGALSLSLVGVVRND